MDSVNNAPKFGGDAWLELQAFKTRQINRREKLNRHKDLINGFSHQNNNNNNQPSAPSNASAPSTSSQNIGTTNIETNTSAITQNSISNPKSALSTSLTTKNVTHCKDTDQDDRLESHISFATDDKLIAPSDTYIRENFASGNLPPSQQHPQQQYNSTDYQCRRLTGIDTIECLLLLKLCDVALKLPIDSRSLLRSISKVKGCEQTSQGTIENLLQKFAHQELITIEEPSSVLSQCNKQIIDDQDDEICTYVISADHTKLVELDKAFGSSDNIRALLLETRTDEVNAGDEADIIIRQHSVPIQSVRTNLDASVHDSDGAGSSSSRVLSFERPTRLNVHMKSNDRKILPPDGKKYLAIDDVESLLSLSSTREKESKKLGEELLELLSKPTAKEKNLLERFRSADGYQVQEFCPKGTKDECRRNSKGKQACDKLHFKKIIAKHTEESLGDCSFLNTCFHMDSCKYVHYEVDYDSKHMRHQAIRKSTNKSDANKGRHRGQKSMQDTTSRADQDIGLAIANQVAINSANQESKTLAPSSIGTSSGVSKFTLSPEEQARIDAKNRKRYKTVLYPPQWIQCDLRYFDMSLLGKFSVVMADPPWDIHMELPYGTMSDDEMRKLNIPALQDEGVIFLWVTGRAMELGRECLALWGYERCDEIIWVKTNQLQRIIRTGRTGHWLNHGKEHCLVGIKGNPTGINRGLDCDIIVAEVRATSHKPDEIYGIIERLSPGTRKIELFGRAHNVQPNWITLGNQLDGVRLVEPSLIEAVKKLNLPYQTGEHTQ